METFAEPNRRILLVDDNAAIHDDFRKVLSSGDRASRAFEAEADELFGTKLVSETPEALNFCIESVSQGRDALERIKRSVAGGERFAMAFVDMRMPPGWDGLETIRRIWEVDDQIETVICTAYSDHSWQDIQRALKVSDRLLILKKPFDKIEVMQMALALTEKWNLRRLAMLQTEGLEALVRVRTRKLVEINKSKSDFLTNIGHELLTPMNGILGMTSLLEETDLTADQREFVDGLNVSGQRLQRLLGQVLKFNRIESGKLALNHTAYDPRGVCRKVSETFAAGAGAKGLRIEVSFDDDLPAQSFGDAEEIQSVLSLLVENAVKFTAKGAIEVRLRRGDGGSDAVEFSVVDSGCGIDTAHRERLEHDFVQLDSGTSRSAEGIGMGLTLARQILRLMRSSLKIESRRGGGSTFSFVLKSSTGGTGSPENVSMSHESRSAA